MALSSILSLFKPSANADVNFTPTGVPSNDGSVVRVQDGSPLYASIKSILKVGTRAKNKASDVPVDTRLSQISIPVVDDAGITRTVICNCTVQIPRHPSVTSTIVNDAVGLQAAFIGHGERRLAWLSGQV